MGLGFTAGGRADDEVEASGAWVVEAVRLKDGDSARAGDVGEGVDVAGAC